MRTKTKSLFRSNEVEEEAEGTERQKTKLNEKNIR